MNSICFVGRFCLSLSYFPYIVYRRSYLIENLPSDIRSKSYFLTVHYILRCSCSLPGRKILSPMIPIIYQNSLSYLFAKKPYPTFFITSQAYASAFDIFFSSKVCFFKKFFYFVLFIVAVKPT